MKFYQLTKRLMLVLLLATGLTAYGQSYQVSGVVKDARSGEGIVGVNVSVKGTSQGTISDVNGNFSVEANGNAVLIFSFIGYQTKEVNVTSSTTSINVSLEEDVTSLEAVVVSGLASTVKRSNLANAVGSVSAKDLLGTTQIQTTDAAMYGKVAGANIRQNGGAPGGGMSIQLRGLASLSNNGASQPLIILDGVYIDNSFQRTGRATVSGAGASTQDDGSNRLADINPADIENIEILKGPSAAAIYGTRANAGVIIITTKKGKAGKTVVSFNQDIGVGSALRLLGVDNWSEDKINFFFPAARRPIELQRFNDSAGKRYDYEDYFYGNNAMLSNTRLSISGGDEKTKFYINGGITDENGVVKNTGFQRYSIRANIEHKLTKDITFNFNSNVLRTNTDRGFTGNQNNTGASIGYPMAYVPNYFSLFPNELGVYPDNPYSIAENPVAVTDKGINNSLVNRFIQAFSLDANLFKTDNSILKFKLNGGLDFVQNSTMIYLPEDLQYQRAQANPGDLLIGKQEAFNTNFQAALVYDYNLGAVNMTTQAGMVRLDIASDVLFNRGRGLSPGQKTIKQANVQEVETDASTKQQDAAVFIQQDMNYQDKIIGTLGMRWDKSTTNGDKDKFYGFPRASVAVNITNFEFWGVKSVSQLKPRFAYGQTAGTVPFGLTYTPLGGVNIGGLLGSTVSTIIGNSLISPERAEEVEFGLDLGLFNNRISFEGTYYVKTSKDNIQSLNLAPGTGVTSSPSNEAELQNKGIELSLGGTVLEKDKFRWFTRVMWWKNEALVTRLDIPTYITGAFGSGLGTFLIREGVAPTTIVGTPTTTSPSEFTVWGDSQPDFTMSWVNNITFLKNFDLNFMWEWRKGGDNINLQSFLADGGGTTKGWFDDDDGDGVPNGRQRPPAPYNNAGRWVQDASFIKLREVGLYYNVPKTNTDKWFGNAISRARIGVSGNNLLLFTKYEGYDPETSTFGAGLASNVDIAPYPTMRRLFFHLQIDF